ncbi:MAG: glycosyltransferase family 39 protein [Candidatus Woykebacteria bacterium]
MMARLESINYKSFFTQNLNKFLLLFIIIFAISFRLYYFVGVKRLDSFFYAQLSYFISSLNFHSFFFENNNYFAIGRLLLYLPTGLAYHFLGVGDISSVLFILLSSLANIVVVYFIGKMIINKWVGLISAFLLAIHPLDVIYSTQYLPDGLIPLFLSSSALSFLYAERETKVEKKLVLYFLTGLLIGLAMYVRESAFIFVSVFIVYAVFKGKFRLDYLWILVGGFFTFFLAGVFFFFGTSDFLYNFHKLFAQTLESKGAIKQSLGHEVLSFDFTKILLTDVLLRPFNLLLLTSTVFSLIYLRGRNFFVLIWFFTILFYLDFVAPLHGLGTQDRYLSIITAPSVIIIGSCIYTVFQGFRYNALGVLTLLVFVTLSANSALKIIWPQTALHPHFAKYEYLAEKLQNKEIKMVYVNNLKDKGYIFNYILNFDSLNYNSFQRGDVGSSNSLIIEWDGLKPPEKGSFVVVDSEKLYAKVRPNWNLISKKLRASLYFVK